MPKTDPTLTLRLPPKLKRALELAAQRHGRSTAQEHRIALEFWVATCFDNEEEPGAGGAELPERPVEGAHAPAS